MGNIKEINIKNQTCYFLNDVINIEDFYPNSLKIDKKSHKNIYIYCIGYITIKNISDHESINSVICLYFIVGKADGHIEKKKRKQILSF